MQTGFLNYTSCCIVIHMTIWPNLSWFEVKPLKLRWILILSPVLLSKCIPASVFYFLANIHITCAAFCYGVCFALTLCKTSGSEASLSIFTMVSEAVVSSPVQHPFFPRASAPPSGGHSCHLNASLLFFLWCREPIWKPIKSLSFKLYWSLIDSVR